LNTKIDLDWNTPDFICRVLDLAVEIQQVPAPTFLESQRAVHVHRLFLAEGLQDVSLDETGNVYGKLPGMGNCPPLVVTAHMDTVFQAGTSLSVRYENDSIHGPGIGDNSLGVAALLGLYWALHKKQAANQLPGDIWFAANTCEEGLGNLRGMHAVVDRFGKSVLAYLVLEGMALGQVYHRALGVQRYRISVRTGGGHSWVDYGRPSAIHELAGLVARLATMPLPTRPRSSLNVGTIAGGTSINTIAAEAHMELDLRSEGAQALRDMAHRVELLVQAANRQGIEASCEVIGQRPSGKLSSLHPLVQLAKHSLEAQGIHPNLTIGSTDANLPISLGYPSVCLGLTLGSGAHTLDEMIYTQPLKQGMAHLVDFILGVFREFQGFIG